MIKKGTKVKILTGKDKNKDGEIIANAFVTSEKISIIINEGIGLTDEIPPLRSFFIERIIGEMKKTDNMDVKDGKISYCKNKVKAPLSKKHLLSCLQEYFPQDKEQAEKLGNIILELIV